MVRKVIIILVIFIAISSFFLRDKILSKISHLETQQTSTSAPKPTDPPQIVSTKPDPLEDNIIGAADVIEITFNRPLENSGEFKLRIEPKIDFKIELSSDRKTARIIPTKPLELGSTYTLFIGTDTKFDGVGAWGQEKIFHFKTIKYRGV